MTLRPDAVRVLVVDDHPLFRSGLKHLLEAEPGFVVVGEAGDAREAVTRARGIVHDLMLLDFALPGQTANDVLRTLAAEGIASQVVLLTAAIDTKDIVEALRLGAKGVLLKASTTELLFKCLRAILAGEYWVGRETVGSVVEALAALEGPKVGTTQPFGLTDRELALVELVLEGCTNREIGERLSIQLDTVKHHLSHIFEKTGTSNRVELAMLAVRERIGGSREPGRG